MKKLVFLFLLLPVMAMAQTTIDVSDLFVPTKVAPAYFGPNAFPVPDIPEARLSGELKASLSGDLFWGQGVPFSDDLTWGPSFYLQIPLWTKRVALTSWGQAAEWWTYSPEIAAKRRLIGFPNGGKGVDMGDIYISTDIHILTEKGWRPDILIRAVLKTASGNTFKQARYYDAAGYFFDANIGKSFYLKGFVKEIRLVATVGFLCWQTDNGRQNDAVQFGALGIMDTKAFRLTAQVGGYTGWERDGDTPVVVKGTLDVPIKDFSPFATFEYGIHDYPFYHLRVGLRYRFQLIK